MNKYPSNILTVVIRNDGPVIHCGDSPSYRSVQIKLTDEQIKQLVLSETNRVGVTAYYEEISRCFIEPHN